MTVLVTLAELEFGAGQVERALRLAGEALEIQSRGKNVWNLATSYLNITAYRTALGDVDGAREVAREGLRLARQAQNAFCVAIAFQHIALLFALRGQMDEAARLGGYVDVQFKELGYQREITEQASYEKLVALLRERLTGAEIAKLASEGTAWSEDGAADEALKV